MSVVQGLVVQDKFLFWQYLPLNNFYFHSGQRDHYLQGETYSLTQRVPTSLPLFSSTLLLTSLQELLLWKLKLAWFLECLCDGDGGRRWQFIGGRGTGRAPSVGGRVPTFGGHPGCNFSIPSFAWLLRRIIIHGWWLVSGKVLVSGDMLVDQIMWWYVCV